jgi:hypothetical protein
MYLVQDKPWANAYYCGIRGPTSRNTSLPPRYLTKDTYITSPKQLVHPKLDQSTIHLQPRAPGSKEKASYN